MDGKDDSIEEIEEPKPFKSVIQRYYTQYYIRNKNSEDQYVFIHSNKLLLVGIADTHPLVVRSQTNKHYVKSVQLLHSCNVIGKHKSIFVNRELRQLM